jgi:hypothetical protein
VRVTNNSWGSLLRRTVAMTIAAATFAIVAVFPLGSDAFATTKPSVGALSKVVMPTPKGLISDRTSLSGGPTGRIGFDEATSSDCNVSSSLHSDWLASQLRYFVSSIQSPQKYLLVCVTLMKTGSSARTDVQKFADNPYLTAKPFAPIPGARVQQTGPATLIAFAVGQYFVFVAGLDLATTGAASVHFVDTSAIAQFHLAK